MSPVRTCLGCRGRDEQANLFRLVRDGDAVIDGNSPRLPGRGGYIHPARACWDLAERRRVIPRFFGPGAVLSPVLGRDWEQLPPAR